MINVTITTNSNRTSDIVDSSMTPRQVLENHGIDYSRTAPMLDGVTLTDGRMDKTFEQLGIGERCYLTCAAKLDNA